MAYIVRKYCEDCEAQKYATVDAPDPNWIPTGCESHTLRDFVIVSGPDHIMIRRLSQSGQPTPDEGELIIWRDSDDNKTYLVYEDPDEGTRKVEMT